eukprot:1736734-Rhodomonas_salina.1
MTGTGRVPSIAELLEFGGVLSDLALVVGQRVLPHGFDPLPLLPQRRHLPATSARVQSASEDGDGGARVRREEGG